MNTSKRAMVGEFIFYDRGKGSKLFPISNDAHIRAEGMSQIERMRQQGAALEFDKRFVAAHTCALAARQDGDGNVVCRGFFHLAMIPFASYRRALGRTLSDCRKTCFRR